MTKKEFFEVVDYKVQKNYAGNMIDNFFSCSKFHSSGYICDEYCPFHKECSSSKTSREFYEMVHKEYNCIKNLEQW